MKWMRNLFLGAVVTVILVCCGSLHAAIKPSNILFVDPQVDNYELIIDGMRTAGTKVVILDGERDGVEQITRFLTSYKSLNSITLLSHGDPGKIHLGSSALGAPIVEKYQTALKSWGSSLTKTGDILIYGCRVGRGLEGESFIRQMAMLTRADIAASDDLTGNLAKGGDWELEVKQGSIENELNNLNTLVAGYPGVLATDTISFPTDPWGGGYDSDGIHQVSTTNFNNVTFKITDDGTGTAFGLLTGIPGALNRGFIHGSTISGGITGIGYESYSSILENGIWFVFATDTGGEFKFTRFDIIETFGVIDTVEVVGFRDGVQVGNEDITFTAFSTNTNRTLTDGAFQNVDEIRIRQKTTGVYDIGFPGMDGLVFDNIVIETALSSNSTPTISIANTTLAYTEKQSPVQIDAAGTVSDADGDADWNGGKLEVQITANSEAADTISLSDSDGDGTVITVSGTNVLANGTVIGTASVSGATVTGGTKLTITFDGDATNANVQEVLQSFRYSNSSDDPGTSNRTITFTATDTNSASESDTRTVSMTATNDPPTATGIPSSVTVLEDVASNVDLSAVTFTDLDDSSLTVTLTATAGTFTASSGGAVTVGGSGTGTLTLAGTAANINTFLDTVSNIKYTTALNSVASTSFTINVNDGTVNPQLGSVTINITPVNDEPSLSNGANQSPSGSVGGVLQTVNSFASMSSPGGGSDESSQTVADFLVSEASDPNNVVSGVDISNSGTLTYTPASGVVGVATINVQVQDSGGIANTGDDTSAVSQFTITIDTVAPTLNSFVRQTPGASSTNADTLVFRATFDEDILNLDASDFAVSGTTATVSSVSTVTPSTVFDITVSGGDLAGLNGTVGLNLSGSQNITDLKGNALPSSEPATDQTYTVDNDAPGLSSFTRQTPAATPTNADTLVFRATFDEDVQGVDAADFAVAGTTATVSTVSTVTPGRVFDITVSGGDLAGLNATVGVNLAGSQNIVDSVGNALPSGEPATDETYTVDNDAPGLSSFTRQTPGASSTNADTLVFRATFDEDVQSVDAADFVVSGTTATVSSVSTVTPNSVYDVTVSGGDLAELNGTVGLNLSGSQNITDSSGNALPSGEPATDETYTVDNDAPGVSSFTRQTPGASSTNADTLVFRATFDEDVQSVDAADFVVSGTTATVSSVSTVTPNSVYDVTVSGGDLAELNGTVGLNLSGSQNISDSSGNALPATEPATDETYTLINGVDLAVTITDAVTSATPGQTITYTIVASNSGPNAEVSASLTDTFPASLTCTYTSVAAGGATGNTAAGSGDLSETLGLPAGASVTYTANCGIDASATGTLSNTVTISGSATELVPGNNSATDSDTVLSPQADLSVTKSDGVTSATPGGSLVYTIVASNSGPSDEPSASLTDTFPASLTCTYTSVAAGGATGNTAAGSGDLSETLGLPAGASVTYTINCAIDTSATGTLSNTVTISGSVTELVPGNNSATDSDTVLSPQADLSVTKSDGVTSATPGGSLVYTIVATNSGPSDEPSASLTDTFSASLTCTYTSVASGGATGNTAAGSGDLSETLGLPAGASVTYTANCGIDALATGTLSNTATIAASITDPVSGNNSATDTTALVAEADLSVTVTDGREEVEAGSSVTYTIVASNGGPGDDPSVTLLDAFPATLTCMYTSAAAGGAAGNTGSGSGNLAETLSLPSGSSVTYTASCLVSSAATGILSNSVSVSASVTDPDSGNNSAVDNNTAIVQTPTPPDMSATTDSGISSGDNLTNDTTPDFTGRVEPNSSVTLESSLDGQVGTTFADGSGNWVITAMTLSQGNHDISVSAIYPSGNTATPSSALPITIDTTAPVLTDAHLSIGGASGTDGAFKVGDTITATWNNTSDGDNNDDVSSLTVDFSQFGGDAAVAASSSGGLWTATHTIMSGVAGGTNLNISVTATDNAGNSSTASDTTNATINAFPWWYLIQGLVNHPNTDAEK